MKINSSADSGIFIGEIVKTLTTALAQNCKYNCTGRKCRGRSGYRYVRVLGLYLLESSYGILKKIAQTKQCRHYLDVEIYIRRKKEDQNIESDVPQEGVGGKQGRVEFVPIEMNETAHR